MTRTSVLARCCAPFWVAAAVLALRALAPGTDDAAMQARAIDLDRDPGAAAASLDGAGPRFGRALVSRRRERGNMGGIAGLRLVPGVGASRLHAWSPWIVPAAGKAAPNAIEVPEK